MSCYVEFLSRRLPFHTTEADSVPFSRFRFSNSYDSVAATAPRPQRPERVEGGFAGNGVYGRLIANGKDWLFTV